MTARADETTDFLTANGFGAWSSTALAGDASTRAYQRLTSPEGDTVILMDWPPETGGDVAPFVALAGYLGGIGVSAPRILAQDTHRGFLLIEDLGDAIFARVLEADPSQESQLYDAAADLLVHLHHRTAPTLPPLEPPVLTEMTELVFSEYRQSITGDAADTTWIAFKARFTRLLQDCLGDDMVFVHRDFHAENLLWLPARHGISRVGLIDFQDARTGHRAYDLVSLLQDARRDVTAPVEAGTIARYIDTTGIDAEAFHRAYAVLGVQRNLRILGIFARLSRRDGKPHYIGYVPRVWAHIERGLQHPALAPVAPMLLESLPRPDRATLEMLRP